MLQVVENAVRAVSHLRSLGCKDIEFSPEDAGRSDPTFLYRVLAAVIRAGATTVNIPDTTGEWCRSALQGMDCEAVPRMHTPLQKWDWQAKLLLRPVILGLLMPCRLESAA